MRSSCCAEQSLFHASTHQHNLGLLKPVHSWQAQGPRSSGSSLTDWQAGSTDRITRLQSWHVEGARPAPAQMTTETLVQRARMASHAQVRCLACKSCGSCAVFSEHSALLP